MTRLIVRAGLLALVTVFFSFVANAQLGRQYRAEIPFDFVVRDRAFTAGSYSLGPANTSTSLGMITLTNRKSVKKFVIGHTQLVSENLETGTMTFIKHGNTYVLSRINTPSFEMKIKADADAVAKNRQAIPEIVSINLVP